MLQKFTRTSPPTISTPEQNFTTKRKCKKSFYFLKVRSDPECFPKIKVFRSSVKHEIFLARRYSQGDHVDSLNLSFGVRFAAPDPNCSLPMANIFWKVRNAGFSEKGHRTLQKFTMTSPLTISTPRQNITPIQNCKKKKPAIFRKWGLILTVCHKLWYSAHPFGSKFYEHVDTVKAITWTHLTRHSEFVPCPRPQLFASEGQYFFESPDRRISRKRSQNALKIYDDIPADNIYPGVKFYANQKLQKNLLFLERGVRS
jgi:hypothetical protein